MDLTPISELLAQGVASGLFSGAQVGVLAGGARAVVCAGQTCFPGALPGLTPRPVTPATLFDLASVSKLAATAPLAWWALGRGVLQADEPVARFLPEWVAAERVTLRHLLTHTSGLVDWLPLYELGCAESMRRAVMAQAPLDEPGRVARYSDLGFMLLGWLLERALGAPLDHLAQALLFSPLGMASCRFVRHHLGASLDDPQDAAATEPTAAARWGALPQGQVHDENAWMLGGVAGHAGLFGNADDLLSFAQALLAADAGPPAPWAIPSSVVRWALSPASACWTDDGAAPLGTRLGGVDTPSGELSAAGSLMSRDPLGATVGHLGFTGTSLWLDRPRQLAVALLTNRVHPDRAKLGIKEFRAALHETAVHALAPHPVAPLWPEAPSLAGAAPKHQGDAAPSLAGAASHAAPSLAGASRRAAPAPRRWGDDERALAVALEAAREAGALARAQVEQREALGTQHKGAVDLVTQVDLACEALLQRRLKAAFPAYAFLGEEGGQDTSGALARWIVDPVDGTTNLAHRAPHFCVCVALEVEGQLQVGVIHDPMRDETFWARRGAGAWLNARPLRVSDCPDLDRALTATGFPYDRRTARNNNVDHLAAILRRSQGVRRMGSAGLDLAWTAAGRYDLYWEQRLKPWDVAAGLLLVDEAGGRATDLDGRPFDLARGDVMVSRGGRLHAEALEALRAVRATP